MAEKKRRARGEGSIRQRKDGTWEARFVIGIDPGTGKEIRKSVYAKTQKEVRMKMTEAVAALDKDDYREPSKNDRRPVAGRMGGGISERGKTPHRRIISMPNQEPYQAQSWSIEAGRIKPPYHPEVL